MILSQFVKFVGIGGINTIITYLLYLLLLLIFSYQISYTVTYIFGIILAYWLNLKFVFNEKSSKRKIVLYPLVYIVQYTFGMIILHIAIDTFSFPKEIAPILVVVLTIPLTFILTKKILSGTKNEYTKNS